MKRGFTLIELLVVIAIIALLVSILLPSLQRAKEIAVQVNCDTNQHAISKAVHMYVAENDGSMPAPNWDGGNPREKEVEKGWLYFTQDPDSGENLPRLQEMSPEQLTEAPKTGVLWEYLEDLAVYRCPADKGPYPENHPSRWLTSYCMNGAVQSYSNRVPFKLSRFNFGDFLFWETDEDSGWWNDGSNHPGEHITKRHKEGASLTTFGGASIWLSFEEYDEEEKRRPGRLWCAPDSEDGT